MFKKLKSLFALVLLVPAAIATLFAASKAKDEEIKRLTDENADLRNQVAAGDPAAVEAAKAAEKVAEDKLAELDSLDSEADDATAKLAEALNANEHAPSVDENFAVTEQPDPLPAETTPAGGPPAPTND